MAEPESESESEEAIQVPSSGESLTARSDELPAAAVQPMGIERWVQFAFVGLALFLFWGLDQLISWVWNFLAEPPSTLVLALAALLAGTIAVILYRHAAFHGWSYDVAAELAKVNWPGRNETWGATVIVIVTSMIAAAIMFLYDALWSALTDLIYKF